MPRDSHSFKLAFVGVIAVMTLAACCNQQDRHIRSEYKVNSSASPVVVTTVRTPAYFLHVANVQICGGYGIIANSADIDWGDAPPEFGTLGSAPGGPAYLNYLVGQHKFSKTGVFNVSFDLKVTCDNNNNTWPDEVKGTTTAYVFDDPVPVSTVTVSPTTIKIGQKATCTIKIQAPAPILGTQIALIADSNTIQLGKQTVDVSVGKTQVTFDLKGLASGTANIYASSGDGTNTVSAPITVQ
jgi:hypothetical protein